MFVVVPVRGGRLPAGGAEVASEYGQGGILLIGEGTQAAAHELNGLVHEVNCAEVGKFRPGAWSAALHRHIGDEIIVLPGCPDGRDLAPRIAAASGCTYFGSVAEIKNLDGELEIQMARWGGLAMELVRTSGHCVVSVMPGLHSPVPVDGSLRIKAIELQLGDGNDVAFIDEREPDAATMDLAEAKRIFGGGAGLLDEAVFSQLGNIAAELGASMGATRVVTDRGWVGHSRQIGTTGVVVDPDLYIAFGVSGAVQHTSGLGQPDHVISVNTDPHCPMMQMSDLAIVCDANAVVAELEQRLGRNAGAA